MRHCHILIFVLAVAAATSAAEEAGRPTSIHESISMLEGRQWAEAAAALEEAGEEAVEPLIDTLRGGQGRAAGRACEVLALIGTEEAVEAVVEAASAEDDSIRMSAIRALRLVPPEDGLEPLRAALRDDPSSRVRWEAARALAHVVGPDSLDALVAALGDEVPYVRTAAVGSLKNTPTAPVAEALVPHLGDPDIGVQLSVRSTLVDFGQVAVPALARTLANGWHWQRWGAAWVLRRIGGEEALEALNAADDDSSWLVRNEVVLARSPAWSGPLWPETTEDPPGLPSPNVLEDGVEVVTARTLDGRWAAVPASPTDLEVRARREAIDGHDFPTLLTTGLHDPENLAGIASITGRSVAEITVLGSPGGLSTEGFMAADEDVLSVLLGDNALVAGLGLTHPQMARPLMHIWTMVEADAHARRWNMALHRWQRFEHILYNGRTVRLTAGDTKGGQLSIFDDDLEGAFWMEISTDLGAGERAFLERRYKDLEKTEFEDMVRLLTGMTTGELQPHYIRRYGFYEGHTAWRTDPVAIAFVFGLRTLEEIEAAFPGRLHEVLTAHHTADRSDDSP